MKIAFPPWVTWANEQVWIFPHYPLNLKRESKRMLYHYISGKPSHSIFFEESCIWFCPSEAWVSVGLQAGADLPASSPSQRSPSPHPPPPPWRTLNVSTAHWGWPFHSFRWYSLFWLDYILRSKTILVSFIIPVPFRYSLFLSQTEYLGWLMVLTPRETHRTHPWFIRK